MADAHDRRKQIDDLVSQDPNINDTKMKEFRMQLEQNLADWERRGARLWRTLCVSVVVYLGVIVFGLFALNGATAGSVRGMFVFPWVIVGWITMIVGGYALILYVGKYMPKIRSLRYDIQSAMIAELQQQVVALRDELRTRPPGGDQHSS